MAPGGLGIPVYLHVCVLFVPGREESDAEFVMERDISFIAGAEEVPAAPEVLDTQEAAALANSHVQNAVEAVGVHTVKVRVFARAAMVQVVMVELNALGATDRVNAIIVTLPVTENAISVRETDHIRAYSTSCFSPLLCVLNAVEARSAWQLYQCQAFFFICRS